MTTMEAVSQLTDTENGIIYGWTISGMYNQTMGPTDSPKDIINRKIPTIIISSPVPSEPLIK